MDVAYPLAFDERGGTATATRERHLRDMIELILFTAPGERVMRPDFGAGLQQHVFAPNSPELAAALRLTVQGAIERWLGDVLQVDALEVAADGPALRVEVAYTIRADGTSATATVTSGAPA